jgi:RNA polymerase sporulation-specific sigma factor
MNYFNIDNENLARLSNLGDNAAQEVLLRRFKGHVRVLARPYFIMGGDREDLMQEGMIGLYKAIREFRTDKNDKTNKSDNNGNFAAFATVCIRNQILDAIKNAARKKHGPLNSYVSMDSPSPEIAAMTAKDQEPESILIHRENRLHIENTVGTLLSGLESEILSLFLEGQSYTQIAHALGRSAKSVDNALFRIRKKVAKLELN